MKKNNSYEDYLFVSSRIRALETELFSRETLLNMANASSLSALYGILEDNKISYTEGDFGEKSFENGLSLLLSSAYIDILGSVPSPELFTVFTYPYDCINLKTALKCAEKGISPDGLLLPYGTVSPENVRDAVQKRSFSVFPKNMGIAAKEAIDVFAKTKNPREIDLILDGALFLDMKESVEENGVEFFSDILRIKADTVNVLTAVRIIKMGAPVSLFERAFVEGGAIDRAFFTERLPKGIVSLGEGLSSIDRYARLGDSLKDGKELTEAERIADSIYLDFIKTAKDVQSGAEVVAGYLAALEAEVKNIRILITGKKLSVSSERLIERLGESYV